MISAFRAHGQSRRELSSKSLTLEDERDTPLCIVAFNCPCDFCQLKKWREM